MSKNAWEEPVVEFGTSHVSAGYTTEKDSMTSVVPQAKPKVFECSHMHTYIDTHINTYVSMCIRT